MDAGRMRSATGRSISLTALLWGWVGAVALAMAGGVGIGLASAWSSWDASTFVFQAANYAVILAAGFIASRRAERLGWLHGGIAGLGYFLLVSWLLVPGFGAALASPSGLVQAILIFVAGALGGVIGRVV